MEQKRDRQQSQNIVVFVDGQEDGEAYSPTRMNDKMVVYHKPNYSTISHKNPFSP